MEKNIYTLLDLPYKYNALEPYISEEQLSIHHLKHAKSYVDGANLILEKIQKAREEKTELDMKSVLKSLSFNIGGHMLHSLFWKSMSPEGNKEPEGILLKEIEKEFQGVERMKEEFSAAALSVEGSGWAALAFCPETKRLMIMQIEKHNANLYPMHHILMVLDVFEHAYYIDYKNERARFIKSFWNIADFKSAEERLKKVI